MHGIAEFHKVSFEQFLRDSKACDFIDDSTPIEIVETIWSSIKIPKRATGGSSGYDFFSPYPFCLRSSGEVTIPTGIRVEMQPGWMLMIMPRSGLSFKYGLRLANTVGNIDSDYFFADNEGHIHVKLITETSISVKEGDRIIQGVFIPHGLVRNDTTAGIRTGGFGSTGVNE